MRFREDFRSSEQDINLTPLVDIIFLLLIFFMVTATFSNQEQIEVQLPSAGTASALDENQDVLIVEITPQAVLLKGPGELPTRTLTEPNRETLTRAFAEAARQTEEPLLLIRADRRAAYERVVLVMDVARQQGMNRLGLATLTGSTAAPSNSE